MNKKIKVLALGAVLWDVIGENEYIGGAPFNFAVNMSRLGATVALVTSVGKDDRGERALKIVRDYGVSDEFAQISNTCCTGFAKATLDASGNAVYDIPYAAFDDIAVCDKLIEKINDFAPDVLYFGSFEQRNLTTRSSFERILREVKVKHVFFDINIRMNFVNKEVLSFGFEKSSIVKLNEDEAKLIGELFYGKQLINSELASKLQKDFNIECIIITLGEKGCLVYTDKEYVGKPIPAKTGDTIGAGDAFSGAFTTAFVKGDGTQKAADKGNLLGSYVAGKRGALPELDEEIKQLILQD